VKYFFRHVSLLLLLAVTAIAADLKVGSLNCYLLFDPSIEHRGKVDDENRMTADQYRAKVDNLATLTKGYEVVVCPDALSSSSQDRHKLGMERLRDAGVVPIHTEAVAYEWCHAADSPKFKDLLAVVKQF
jgi:hypothetical protein